MLGLQDRWLTGRLVAVDRLQGGDGGEGEFVWGDAEDWAVIMVFLLDGEVELATHGMGHSP